MGTGFDGHVEVVTIFDRGSGPEVYAAGNFVRAGPGGDLLRYIARWDGEFWRPLEGGTTMGMNFQVFGVEAFDDGIFGPALYATGQFTIAGNVGVSFIARWNGSGWSPVGTGLNNWGLVLHAIHDGPLEGLYAGGHFFQAGGVANTRAIARWDGENWHPLSTGALDSVLALVSHNDGSGTALYAGGRFTSIGGVSAQRIAKWNGSMWSALGAGVGGWVWALASIPSGPTAGLYVGGAFTNTGATPLGRVARWTPGDGWHTMEGGVDGEVRALGAHDFGSGVRLVAGGGFVNAGGNPALRVATWDGESWAPLGGGMNNFVFSLVSHDTGDQAHLYAGGNFTMASGQASLNISTWAVCDDQKPCIPDQTGHGVFDFFDVQVYLNLYSSGSPLADLNNDGTLDFFDVQMFLGLYSAGCA